MKNFATLALVFFLCVALSYANPLAKPQRHMIARFQEGNPNKIIGRPLETAGENIPRIQDCMCFWVHLLAFIACMGN